MKQRVVLADDHPIIRLALRRMLESSGKIAVVAEAASPSELLQALSTTACDVIVSDLCMPDDRARDGLALVQRLTRLYPSTPVVILTALSSTELLRSILQQGARGLVHKEGNVTELLFALHAINEGEIYIDRGLRALLAPPPKEPPPALPLTLAEMEVLRLFAYEGLSARQIAKRLHRSHKTVSRHKRSAQAKLGLDTDQALIDYCRRVNLCLS